MSAKEVQGVQVQMIALLSVRELLGWSARQVEFSGGTLGDLLGSVTTHDGRSLQAVMTDGRQVTDGFAVRVNDLPVRDLNTPLQSQDQVLTMDFIRAVAGGSV